MINRHYAICNYADQFMVLRPVENAGRLYDRVEWVNDIDEAQLFKTVEEIEALRLKHRCLLSMLMYEVDVVPIGTLHGPKVTRLKKPNTKRWAQYSKWLEEHKSNPDDFAAIHFFSMNQERVMRQALSAEKGHVCQRCGKLHVQGSYSNDAQLAERVLCFHCDYWTTLLRKDTGLIMDGEHYTAGPIRLNEKSEFLGFGGAWFFWYDFRRDSACLTNNMWHQGRIPKRFGAPNNCERISGAKYAELMAQSVHTEQGAWLPWKMTCEEHYIQVMCKLGYKRLPKQNEHDKRIAFRHPDCALTITVDRIEDDVSIRVAIQCDIDNGLMIGYKDALWVPWVDQNFSMMMNAVANIRKAVNIINNHEEGEWDE